METLEIPIELNKVDEDDELYEEKIIEVEKVVAKEYCSGEVVNVKKKDGLTRRCFNNKVDSVI